jgi:tetratricopeptide (TPR) repeat protein
MQNRFVSLAVVVLGCLAIPANLNAQDENAYQDRGQALLKKGDFDMAIANFNQALAIAPNFMGAYVDRGTAWIAKGEYEKAIADYNQALAINPNDADNCIAYHNRGELWFKKGEYEKAIADYNQALAINPNDAGDYDDRGEVWFKKGEFDKALADYNQALAIDPNDADAYNSLGSFYATCPDAKYRDAKKAFENASKGYQLSDGKRSTSYISKSTYADTLAEAYAENGDFDAAKEWGEKAIELAKTDIWATDKDRAELRSRLELYKQKKPYRKK